MMQQKGVAINGEIVSEDRAIDVGKDFMFEGKYAIVRVGKKSYALVEVKGQR